MTQDSVGTDVKAVLLQSIKLIDELGANIDSTDEEREQTIRELLSDAEDELERHTRESQPIRTIHHFACTGGTLISKCIACMPNTQLLSEVEPFSRMQSQRAGGFNPTDLIQQIRHGSRGSNTQLEGDVFLAGLQVLNSDCKARGQRLVLRDHTHSRYCVGPSVGDTPTLRSLAKKAAPVLSIVSVRHPLDSFLSAQKRGWLHLQPATIDEYSIRYGQFLDEYQDCALFKYEDFVSEPRSTLLVMCETLDLPFAQGFERLFSVHRLSGDSGRSSNTIGARSRRPIGKEILAQLSESQHYLGLCERLGYQA